MSRYNDDEFDDSDSVISRLTHGLTNRFGVRHVVMMLAVVAVVALGLLVFSSGDGGGDAGGNVPMVVADATPYKIVPDEIGGMAVPNQKSTIFETLKGQDEKTGVENLLADEEQPIAKADIPEPKADVKTLPPEIKTAMVDAAADTIKPEPVPAPPEASEVAKTEPAAQTQDVKIPKSVKEEPKADVKKVEDKKPEVKKVEPKKEDVKIGSKSLQFAAVKSDAEARNLWKNLQSKNPELSGYTLRVQRADLGEKGTYYRVQIAGLSDDKAASLCTKIKSRGASCMVVK